MQREPYDDERSLAPGFYWVLPVHDPDHDPDPSEAWALERQPARWTGKRWAMLDTPDWEVRWIGDCITPPEEKE